MGCVTVGKGEGVGDTIGHTRLTECQWNVQMTESLAAKERKRGSEPERCWSMCRLHSETTSRVACTRARAAIINTGRQPPT